MELKKPTDTHKYMQWTCTNTSCCCIKLTLVIKVDICCICVLHRQCLQLTQWCSVGETMAMNWYTHTQTLRQPHCKKINNNVNLECSSLGGLHIARPAPISSSPHLREEAYLEHNIFLSILPTPMKGSLLRTHKQINSSLCIPPIRCILVFIHKWNKHSWFNQIKWYLHNNLIYHRMESQFVLIFHIYC